MDHLPLHTFHRCVARCFGEHKVKRFSCLDQYLCMAFAQLTYRESLRDIEACLRAQSSKLYHLGIRGSVARNTLANANATRDWRIYCDFAQSLIATARSLYANESFGLDLKDTVYALDATTIDLCLSVFPWAPFRSTKAAINCTRCWICAATSRPSFLSVTASSTTSTSWINCCRRPAPSTSWIVAISISIGSYRATIWMTRAVGSGR
jgi:lambda repressor-like predicted transcriptional regulator